MKNNLVEFNRFGSACDECHSKNDCLFQQFTTTSKTLRRGEALFRQEDSAKSLFIVKSGSFKSYFANHDGTEQISAFHFPGDLIGGDALDVGYHRNTEIALETGAACQLPIDALAADSANSHKFSQVLLQRLSRLVAAREAHTFVLANYSAKAKLAWFLFGLAEELKARRLDSSTITLSMSRHDISNYLAMAVETVSRVLSEFELQRILLVDRKLIRILSHEALASWGDIFPSQHSVVPLARMQ